MDLYVLVPSQSWQLLVRPVMPRSWLDICSLIRTHGCCGALKGFVDFEFVTTSMTLFPASGFLPVYCVGIASPARFPELSGDRARLSSRNR